MQNWLIEEEKTLMSYHPQSFVDLKQFALAVPNLYSEKRDIPTSINAFLTTINFEENLKKIKQNSTSKTHFTEVFFKWFNAFKVLKFMHYARDNYYPNLSIAEGANSLLELMDEKQATKSACHKLNNKALLLAFRQLDVA